MSRTRSLTRRQLFAAFAIVSMLGAIIAARIAEAQYSPGGFPASGATYPLNVADAAGLSGPVPVAAGGLGNGSGLLPEVTSATAIPGTVGYWVCDLGLTLGDSGTVYSWVDQVSGAVETNAVNADQPTKISNWVNGHCGVQFTNNSQTINLADQGWTALGYPYAIVAVVEPTTSSPTNAAYIVSPGTGTSGYGLRQNASGLASGCYDGTLSTSAVAMVVNQVSLVGCMFGGVNDGGQVAPIVNFLLAGKYSEGSTTGSRSTVANGLAIGGLADGSAGQGFGGMIGMVAVYNTTLNRQYLLQFQAYAQTYYGMAF